MLLFNHSRQSAPSFVGWLSGREAIYIESLTEEQIGNDCVAVLKKFLKKDIPSPKRVIR